MFWLEVPWRFKRRGLSHKYLGPALTVGRGSELGGGPGFGLWAGVDAFWAVSGADVAETALLGAGNAYRGFRRRDATHEAAEVSDRALVDSALRNALCAVAVNDFSGEPGVLILGQRPGQGIHVDHDLVTVPGLLLAVFDVDDADVVLVEHEQVWLAVEGGRVPPEVEGVLVLEADMVAAAVPLVSLLVELCAAGGV